MPAGAPADPPAAPPASEALARVVEYLCSVPAWYLATSVGERPHVRPFSFAAAEGGRLWFCTANDKDVYEELSANPWFELSAWKPGSPWLVLSGRAEFAEPSPALRQAGFEHMTWLGEAHESADDGKLVFFWAAGADAWIRDITGQEEKLAL
jgi:uncharacterized pyridoxamine 5'-phosphate oxidase family protein